MEVLRLSGFDGLIDITHAMQTVSIRLGEMGDSSASNDPTTTSKTGHLHFHSLPPPL